LQSNLLRGDPKLEGCLVNDKAHVLQGARGEHVSKLQQALDALGNQAINPDEITSKTYGPSSASAVLSYKQKRNIINFSYQTQADKSLSSRLAGRKLSLASNRW
jgi:peptidoglycan hydrolase-like protein with peptidoglycan-binding domain